jgi:hypothetical protein
VRAKSTKASVATLNDIKELVPGSRQEVWLGIWVAKGDIDFKNRLIIKTLPEKNSEETFPLILLELDRAFAAKNYSRAKDVISYIEKHYTDWPDIFYYTYKINFESSEEKTKANPEQLALYSNKCKSMTKSVARKFRYDFELCLRGVE